MSWCDKRERLWTERGRVILGIRKKLFTIRVVRHWHGLPREWHRYHNPGSVHNQAGCGFEQPSLPQCKDLKITIVCLKLRRPEGTCCRKATTAGTLDKHRGEFAAGRHSLHYSRWGLVSTSGQNIWRTVANWGKISNCSYIYHPKFWDKEHLQPSTTNNNQSSPRLLSGVFHQTTVYDPQSQNSLLQKRHPGDIFARISATLTFWSESKQTGGLEIGDL